MNDARVGGPPIKATDAINYTAYGYMARTLPLSIAYNGEWLIAALESYLLGNGYRIYNPAFMRFMSPDSVSPFERKALNSYGYCQNDPINHIDPSGHMLRTHAPPKTKIASRQQPQIHSSSRVSKPTPPPLPAPGAATRRQRMDEADYSPAEALIDVKIIKLEKQLTKELASKRYESANRTMSSIYELSKVTQPVTNEPVSRPSNQPAA